MPLSGQFPPLHYTALLYAHPTTTPLFPARAPSPLRYRRPPPPAGARGSHATSFRGRGSHATSFIKTKKTTIDVDNINTPGRERTTEARPPCRQVDDQPTVLYRCSSRYIRITWVHGACGCTPLSRSAMARGRGAPGARPGRAGRTSVGGNGRGDAREGVRVFQDLLRRRHVRRALHARQA